MLNGEFMVMMEMKEPLTRFLARWSLWFISDATRSLTAKVFIWSKLTDRYCAKLNYTNICNTMHHCVIPSILQACLCLLNYPAQHHMMDLKAEWEKFQGMTQRNCPSETAPGSSVSGWSIYSY